MTPLRYAELLCTVGRIGKFLGLAFAGPFLLLALPGLALLIFSREIFNEGVRLWNAFHNIRT